MKYWTKKDLKIPKLAFGTYMLEGEKALEAVCQALDLGMRHIDTAQIYSNEEAVGSAIKKSPVPREEIFLTTKIWRDSLSSKGVLSSFQESLKRLKMDYVDLLLIHWPNEEIPLEETLEAFQSLKEKGRIRHIGVSNFTCDLLRQALKICPDILSNQVEYHPLLSQEKLLRELEGEEVFLTAYSPLARGKVFQIQQIQHLSKKYGKSPSQISLKWLIDQKNVVALFKASSRQHIEENLNIFDFELEEEDRKILFRLNKNRQRVIDPPFAPNWDE